MPTTPTFWRELAEIARDVGGAARVKRFAGDLDHRDRGLGGDAADLAPDELVQHEIADNEEAFAGAAPQNLLKSVEVMRWK